MFLFAASFALTPATAAECAHPEVMSKNAVVNLEPFYEPSEEFRKAAAVTTREQYDEMYKR